MSEDNLMKCAHGIPHEQRKRDGCRKCDVTALCAGQDARAFRARVIQTARAVLPSLTWPSIEHTGGKAYEIACRDAFKFAEAFEKAADEYLKG